MVPDRSPARRSSRRNGSYPVGHRAPADSERPTRRVGIQTEGSQPISSNLMVPMFTFHPRPTARALLQRSSGPAKGLQVSNDTYFRRVRRHLSSPRGGCDTVKLKDGASECGVPAKPARLGIDRIKLGTRPKWSVDLVPVRKLSNNQT